MERKPWVEKTFSFGGQPESLHSIAHSLLRLNEEIETIIQNCSSAELVFKPGGKWSVQEHIGHLIDLDELHTARLADFRSKKPVLRPADMKNQKTIDAHHNNALLPHLLLKLKSDRAELVRQLHSLPAEIQNFESQHPRLKVMMKPVDMADFVLQHDQHHLESMKLCRAEWKKLNG